MAPNTKGFGVDNVFDETLICDLVEFAEAADAAYVGEWQKLDDGLELKTEEEGLHVRYCLGRHYDDDSVPYKLVFSKMVYAPVSSGGVLALKEDEVYSDKVCALREGDVAYRMSDPRERGIQADPNHYEYQYAYVSAEEAQGELEGAGIDELAGRLMTGPSECFVDLYFSCMDSSYGPGDLGAFEDRKG